VRTPCQPADIARKKFLNHEVGLSEIYGTDPVARAIEDAFIFEAFSSEYIANLLQQRARFHKESAALQLTRREDLLDIRLEHPDLSVYERISDE
jgi:hypothetical protein